MSWTSRVPERKRRSVSLLSLLLLLPSPAKATLDVVPPGLVQNLTAGKSGSQVVLTWPPVQADINGQTEIVTGYKVYGLSSPNAATWTLLGQPSGTTFSKAATGTAEYFIVTATDATGNEGPPWRFPSIGLPQTFAATVAMHGREPIVSWSQPPGITSDGYIIYLGAGAASYQFSKRLGGSATLASTLVLPPGDYYIQVVALVSGIPAARSTVARSRVPFDRVPPGSVSDLRLAKSGPNAVLSWSPVTRDLEGNPETVASYEVWSFPPSMSPWSSAGNSSGTTTTRPLAGADEYYFVTASDVRGNSGPPYPLPGAAGLPTFPLTARLGNADAEVSWTPPAVPHDRVVVYWGRATTTFDRSIEVGAPGTLTRVYPIDPGARNYFRALAHSGSTVVAQSTIASGSAEPGGSCSVEPDCDDDIACTQDECVEGRCYAIPSDAAASDGQFCSGIESCDPAALGGIVRSAAPCGSGTCNEPLDRCDSVPTDGAVFQSFHLPASRRVGPAGAATVWFNVRNVGSTDWTRATHALGAVGNTDPFTTAHRQLIPDGVNVRPGASLTFPVPTTPPGTAGSYLSDWQMVRLGAPPSVAAGATATGIAPLSLSLTSQDDDKEDKWFMRPAGAGERKTDPEIRDLPGGPETFMRAFTSSLNAQGAGGNAATSTAGDVSFGEVAGQTVTVVNCAGLAELQLWSPDPMEIPKGYWFVYLGGRNMLGGVVGGTNPNVPKLAIAADEDDPGRPAPGLILWDQYVSVGGYETWQIAFDARGAGVQGDYEITVSEGTQDVCHYKLPVRVLPATPHIDMYTPGVPLQHYEGVVPRGGRYLLSIEGRNLLGATVAPSIAEQVLLYDMRADRDAAISGQLVVLTTATPGTELELVVRSPGGQETRVPVLIGEGVFEPVGGSGAGGAGLSAKSSQQEIVNVVSLPQQGGRGRLKSLPLTERRINLEVQETQMPPGSEGLPIPTLPPIFLQDVVARDPSASRQWSGNGQLGEPGGSGFEWGAVGSPLDFSASFSFLHRWLIHYDARLFSLAFDVETGEFAPFIQGPPGTHRLLGGISVVSVFAADLTVYGGCSYSTILGWICRASVCWSVVSAIDAVGQGYSVSRKGCWFDEEWGGESDSGQTHTFDTPGDCSTVTPCVTGEEGTCVTDVEVTDCCNEELDLTTQGLILHSGGQPVVVPFQWTNATFPSPEPPTASHGVAAVEGIRDQNGDCCGDRARSGFESCDPPGSIVSLPGGATAVCNAACGYCTDGVAQSPWEQCDDGNRVNNDACPNSCFLPNAYTRVYVEWAAVLRPDLVKVPLYGFGQYDYGVGDNWPLSAPVTHTSPAKIRQGGWFTVDPAADSMIGPEARSLGYSKGYEQAHDSGNRACKDLFRYSGQNDFVPECTEQPEFDGTANRTFVGVERLGSNHIRIYFEGSARPGCIVGPDTFAPSIDYCVKVELRQQVQGNGQLGPVEYRATGTHDGFPWHNLLIGTTPDNAQSVYEYDVCGKGGTLDDLPGSCVDRAIAGLVTTWREIPGTGGH